MYWQKVKFYIRVFPVNKDCNRDMARYSSVFDTNPPATACFDTPEGDFLGRPFYGRGNVIFRIERTIFGELFTGSYKAKALDMYLYIYYISYI